MVALVPVSDVKNPLVAVRIDAKKLVLVAAVVVLRRMFAKMFAPEKVLASERSVDDAAVLPMQTPRILKQPLVSWMPLAKVEVALPVTAKLVVVALVVVERSPVKFWRVVEPLARIVCAESAPMEPDCAERLVEDALVAKVLVEVLLVIVALVPRRLVNSALVAERTDAKKEVEVELVLVLFNSVMFWKVVEDVKTFCPEKVLLFARRVVEAPVIAVLQPKVPAEYVSAVAQVASPAPKKFEVKRLVEDAVVAKLVVLVAFVVVERERFGRKKSVPRVSVALMRASARAGVKYRFDPSVTLVVRSPSDEVASCWYEPPAYEPRRMPATEGDEMPVPPPAAVRTPAMVLVKVMVFPAAVMVVEAVRP
jgi:hypothetical protein